MFRQKLIYARQFLLNDNKNMLPTSEITCDYTGNNNTVFDKTSPFVLLPQAYTL